MSETTEKETKIVLCNFEHHQGFGTPMKICPIHNEPQTCGPFEHGCMKCRPRKCGICGSNVILCCC